jgi:outer membrane autotransporter protein
VTNSATIVTQGASSHGIFAQSVGGGGGFAGILNPYGMTTTTFGANAHGVLMQTEGIGATFAGSLGGLGSGGNVVVVHSGDIITSGQGSHGIFAQSAGGLLSAGTVGVSVNGDISTHGRDSDGIRAQSIGGTGGSNITVDILSGRIQGGSGSGGGVHLMNGAANTVSNRGTITTVDGMAGAAIRGTTGNDTINNFGTVVGSVDLGTGSNALNNNAGATFNTGSIVNLGVGRTLTNAGTLSPGGSANPFTTTLTGSLVQTGTGTFETDVYADGRHDRLVVGRGSAALNGTLLVRRHAGLYQNGTTYRVLDAAGGAGTTGTFNNIVLPEAMPLVRFDVYRAADAVEVGVDAESFTTVATNPTHQRIAQHLDTLLPTATGDLAAVLGEFQGLPASGFGQAFGSLGPMAYDSTTQAAVGSTRPYTQSLQRRLETVRAFSRTAGGAAPAGPVLLAAAEADPSLIPILGTYRLAQPQAAQGLWASAFGQWDDQDTTPGFPGYTARTGGFTVGYDYTFGSRLTAGVSLGYADTDVDQAANQGGGRVQGVFPSVYASYFTATAYVEGALSYGHNWYKNQRPLVIGGIERLAQSDHQGNAFATYLGAGYAHPLGAWAVGPVGALQYVYLAENSFQETGAGSLNLSVAARDTNALVSELGVRVSGTVKTPAGSLIPDLSLLWRYDFDLDDRVLTTTYAGAPGMAFSIAGQPPSRHGLVVRPGLTFLHPAGVSTTLRYAGQFQNTFESHALFGEVRVQF